MDCSDFVTLSMSPSVSSSSEMSVVRPLTTIFRVFSSGLGNVKNLVWVFLRYFWIVLNMSGSANLNFDRVITDDFCFDRVA